MINKLNDFLLLFSKDFPVPLEFVVLGRLVSVHYILIEIEVYDIRGRLSSAE